MPRFSAFGRRKSTADSLDAAALADASPSFRVLERSEVTNGKSFDGGARLAAKIPVSTRTTAVDVAQLDDNIFADMKINRGSGSSNTTKTNSTDDSSRHSNASTAPSSADMGHQEDWRTSGKKTYSEVPLPPIPKSRSSGFLSAAGRSFSFGGQKKHLPPAPVEEEPLPSHHPLPPTPQQSYEPGSRARATTSSTTSTATPPKIEQDFNMDMGGDFGKMLMGFDKRQSVAMRDDARQGAAPRSLTGNRMTQPSPIHIDRTSKIEASPYSWTSHRSDDNLLASPMSIEQPPRRHSPLALRPQVPTSNSDNSLKSNHALGRTPSFGDDEESKLLKDSISNAKRFLSGTPPAEMASSARYRQSSYESRASSRFDSKAGDDDNLFDTGLVNSSRTAQRYVARKPTPPQNKVMTPAEFERYRQDRERHDGKQTDTKATTPDDDDDEEPTYEDDEDELEKSKQAAKQRRKQEAHMTVYRQQMMKVTGEGAGGGPSRPSMSMSFSTPNLTNMSGPPGGGSDNSDEDEEVPLAILAAHGFPNKGRAPSRLATMASNPNLRIAQAPSYQRPGSVVNEAGPGGRLPVFARNLPQDPYVGAGLIQSAPRESLHFGGGASTPPSSHLPPGGLIGVIANEERSRAMRRGSPALESGRAMPIMGAQQQFDPVAGIPSQMMYPQMANMSTPMLGGHDQAAQMNQQMQFMQMQMQLMQMQMMAHGGGGQQRPMSHMPGQTMYNAPGMGGMGNPDAMRHSFMDNGSIRDMGPARPADMHMRTMSMVQPSSASWIQPPQPGYAPSIRIQGANGYAPSIAPSERSNVGLPGRYRPVSQAVPSQNIPPMPSMDQLRKSVTMSGALAGGWEQGAPTSARTKPPSPLLKVGHQEEEDDDEGWEAMKAKREKKRSMWRSKKTTEHSDIGALIS